MESYSVKCYFAILTFVSGFFGFYLDRAKKEKNEKTLFFLRDITIVIASRFQENKKFHQIFLD